MTTCDTPTGTGLPRLHDSSAVPVYDEAAQLVRVPLIGRPSYATFDADVFEALKLRKDITVCPMSLGRHYGEHAVRVKERETGPDGFRSSWPVCNMVARPPRGTRWIHRDGDPLNLRRSNLVAAPVNRETVQGVA